MGIFNQAVEGIVKCLSAAVNVGPYRVLFGTQTKEKVITTADPVLLDNNASMTPKFVRIRLERGETEGRVAFMRINSASQDAQEAVDLTNEYKYEAFLMNGEELYCIGVWPLAVPFSIKVTVASWSPGNG